MSSNNQQPDILYCYRDKNQHRSYTPSLVTALRRHIGSTDITYQEYIPKKIVSKKKNKKVQ